MRTAGSDWKLDFRQMTFDQMAISVTDDAISPPQQLNADKGRLQLQLTAGRAGSQFNLKVDNAALSLADVALTSGSQTPLKLAQLGFSDGAFDLAARHVSFGRLYAEGARLLIESLPAIERATPQSGPGNYDSWPSRAQVSALRAKGVRLVRLGDLLAREA